MFIDENYLHERGQFKLLLVKLKKKLLDILSDIGWLANYQLNILLGLTMEKLL